ncbi:nucleoside triphosphate pyrophosphohydrolase [Luteolibacter sp. AS25]|uniref:nucleoside triphosphate pyrophosphohydrolase n=1 Tax=Luteolibacter sp. AS25 TaxID=3135776 RepID=UPI00398B6AA1
MTDEQMINATDDSVQVERLKAIMHRLRSPGGCPWDAEQTHQSIISNVIEEAYEVVDAIQRSDDTDMCEELGDLLLQVVFHSEIAQEDNRFDLNQVARVVSEKLIRRHPHVFATSDASDTDQVLKQWDAIKRQEKGEKEVTYLHGTGKGLPAIIRAAKLQKKAAKIGFDWPLETGVISKIREELYELESAIDSQDHQAVEEELGDLLFSAVNLARFRKIDPEILMAKANEKFERRFSAMENQLHTRGSSLEEAGLAEMEQAWADIKAQENK